MNKMKADLIVARNINQMFLTKLQDQTMTVNDWEFLDAWFSQTEWNAHSFTDAQTLLKYFDSLMGGLQPPPIAVSLRKQVAVQLTDMCNHGPVYARHLELHNFINQLEAR